MNPPRQRIGAATRRLAIKPVSLPFNMTFLRRAAAAITGGSGLVFPVMMGRSGEVFPLNTASFNPPLLKSYKGE